jgi:hypothetical protein
MNKLFLLLCLFIISLSSRAQGSVEAEFDTLFNYQFKSLKGKHQTKVLIDEGHNTIYAQEYGRETAREMLRIMTSDGFSVNFSSAPLLAAELDEKQVGILVLHGMPNDKLELGSEAEKEIFYKSPLKEQELIDIVNFVHKGGSLLLFLSHFPGGSGALPLLEAFQVKFRDGYAYHPDFPGHNGGLCSHFIMNKENKMLNTEHPVFEHTSSTVEMPRTIKFLCGAAIFRNREDNILSFPENTVNYTPEEKGSDLEEQSDAYAGMIGFDYGRGRVVISTDQGIFRSLDLLIDGERIPVTIHDPDCDNAALFLNIIRWLGRL